MRIKSVTIEGMHNVEKKTYEFNQLNYLHGHNGAGKSTVLQAVQLALLGYIPGMNKTKESIFSNSNNHTMAVTVVIENESQPITVRRVWTNSGKSINSSVFISPDGYDVQSIVGDLELPVFNFNEFVGMTANKLKDWFIKFLPNSETSIDWSKELTESSKEVIIVDDTLIPQSIDSIMNTSFKGVDQVRHANEYFKSELSFMKQELQRIQSTIKSLVFYEDCSTDLNIEDIKEEIKSLTDKKICIMNYLHVRDRNTKIYEELSKLNLKHNCVDNDEDYIKLKRQFQELDDAIQSISKDIENIKIECKDIEQKRMNVISERKLKSKIITSGGICQYTNSECPSIIDMIEHLKLEINSMDEEIKKYDGMIYNYTVELHDLNDKLNDYSASKSKVYSDIRHLEDMYQRKIMLSNQIESLDNSDECNISVEEIENKIQELSDLLVKVAANNKYTELTEKLSSQKFEIEQSIEALKIWDKLTGPNGLQTKMMNEPFIEFVDKMNKYIEPLFGENVSTKFNLIEKANSFSFGIERGNSYIPYDLLSSGEKCMFMLAMMICIVDDSSSQLKLIMVDDLFDHLDDKNVNKLFDSLYEVTNIQFIVAGVKTVASNEFVIEVK